MLVVIHGFLVGLFLVVGSFHPRLRRPIINHDTIVNLLTGAILAAARILTLYFVATRVSVERCDLSFIRSPVAQALTVFVLSDFTRYWLHYLHHRVEFLWRFHRVHHSSDWLDASSGLRMHVVDFVQLSLIPVLLFNLLFDCSSFSPWVWVALVIVTDAFDAFQHANIRMTLRNPLTAGWNLLFNNPVFHSWHHSINPGEYNGNYGQTLTVWDRIFNTYIPHREAATEFGLPRGQRLDTSLLGLQTMRAEIML